MNKQERRDRRKQREIDQCWSIRAMELAEQREREEELLCNIPVSRRQARAWQRHTARTRRLVKNSVVEFQRAQRRAQRARVRDMRAAMA